ncbi:MULTISPECIES: DUF2493 domain-containing protein [unclassified Ruminococcus]|uniref:DUF2493 domain-containing protein n=1 Tax=unclassified Ruminococcus TaxID=2608920 RepID=UPI00210F1A5F|nr:MULTISPECIES: DUF2493 domain-containing protein [unclassified Ruminococcus]MCQ4022767.1 hypothetical protein [Ruminococcus sp. zg-924]MCQ4115007.1 hypothetical protein [Ruminococcus sp. zg-921]
MKVAVIGSRTLTVNNLQDYLPHNTDEIVSGGAIGIDSCAKKYATKNKIKYTEFLPDYKSYGRSAPLKRNIQIIDYSDMILAFWDGKSRGTQHVIKCCMETGKKIKIFKKR